MKYVPFLAVLLFPHIGHAAITSDNDCQDATGVSVYFEAQPMMDDNGEVSSENLYQGHIRISVKGIDVTFKPEKFLIGGEGASIAAWSSSGEYVIVNARKKIGEDEDTVNYSGTMEFRVRSKQGTLRRPEGTKVTCKQNSEG